MVSTRSRQLWVGRRSRVSRRAASAWLLVLACGCYEIPPILPPNYIDDAGEPGWPPLRAYHSDPFHPANVLFHRLFQLECEGVCGDVPVPERGAISAADRLEILVLLDDVEANADRLPPPGLALLRVDLANVKRRFQGGPEAERELAARIDSSLRRIGNASVTLPPPPRGALLALRADLDASHPRIAGGELEAWELVDGRARIHWLERARWRNGEDPWREVSSEERLGVRASAEAAPGIAFESKARLCSPCHRSDAAEERAAAGFPGSNRYDRRP